MNFNSKLSRRDFLTLGGIVGVGTGAALLATPFSLQASINSANRINGIINYNPEDVGIRNYKLELSKINSEINVPIGAKIGIISDLHINEFNAESVQKLNKIKELDLDILIIAGDFIPRNTNGVNEYFGILDDLMKHMKGKVFAVLGNHDYIKDDSSEIKDDNQLKEQLKKWGIKLLENDNEQLILRGEKIILIGKGSHLRGRFEAKNSKIDSNKGLNILITHEPIGFNKAQDDFHLGVAGHTHGSPDWIIEVAKLISLFNYKTSFNECDFKYNNGLYLRGDQRLLTNSGIGRHHNEKYFTQKLIDIITIA